MSAPQNRGYYLRSVSDTDQDIHSEPNSLDDSLGLSDISDTIEDETIREVVDGSSQTTQATDKEHITMATSHITLNKFQGNPGDRANEWLRWYENFAKLNRYNDDVTKHTLPFFLDGTAKDWYQRQPEDVKDDYEKLVTALKARFLGHDDLTQGMGLWALQKQPSEGVEDYFNRVNRLNDGNTIPESFLVSAALKGLTPDLQRIVMPQNHSKIEDLRKATLLAERTLLLTGATVNVNSVRDNEIDSLKGEIRELTKALTLIKMQQQQPVPSLQRSRDSYRNRGQPRGPPQRRTEMKNYACRNCRDLCDSIMPESPETKGQGQTPITSPTPMTGGVTPGLRETARPHSNNNAGEHSPVNVAMMNGRMPTPPTVPMSSSQQLPPACGARQLSKLKRFLTTLQQFGSDISPEIGERVRALVLGLVNSHLSIEEFHSKLQEATNFPLRPFVIPFLKANLPLLQRELVHLARMAKETPQNYLAQNEHILFNATQSPLEPQDTSAPQINENGKRLSPETRGHENGLDVHPAKRHQPTSPHGPSRISPSGIVNLSNGPIRLEDISISRELREREKLERERLEKERPDHRDRDMDSRERHFPSYNFGRSESAFDPLERFDDDWRHVETMLNCIIGMVDKTRRALSVLQDRSLRDREELSVWMRRCGGEDSDLKKRDSWLNVRSTEERISDVRRRAEEAVQEVKRQAMLELHKAVAAADSKANELVSQERAKMERAVQDIRKQTREEVIHSINHQEESSESCWNCGRKASETCSGCNTARYCGSFCQHKDWENHHHVCGKASISSLTQVRDTPPQTVSPSLQVPASPHSHNSPSPVNSVSSVKSVSRSSTPVDVKQTEARAAEVSR